MKEFGKILGLTLGFGILAALLASIPSRPVAQAAGSAPVIVTNTPAQAVPVSQTGTWNVGITGTPTVGWRTGVRSESTTLRQLPCWCATWTTPRDMPSSLRSASSYLTSRIAPLAPSLLFLLASALLLSQFQLRPMRHLVRRCAPASPPPFPATSSGSPPSLWRVPSRCRFPSLRQQLSTMSGLRTSPLAFTRPPARPSRSPSNANRPPPAPPSPQSPSPATLWICRSAGLLATQYPEV